RDMEAILGYSSQEYQKIERGVTDLLDTARDRIIQAIHEAGKARIAQLLRDWQESRQQQIAWQAPDSVPEMVILLARREGGLIPLARYLQKVGLKSLGKTRLRSIAQGRRLPAWPVIEQLAKACGVGDLAEARHSWSEQYRARLQKRGT